MEEYRGVLIEDTGLLKSDRRDPLMLAGFRALELRRADSGGCVDVLLYRPGSLPTTVARARRRVDAYAASGFTWVQ